MFRRKTVKEKTDPEHVLQNSSPPPVSDESFLENIYREILGREIDGMGKEHYLHFLKEGNTQTSVILDILKSEEFINKVIRENVHLLSITEEKSDAYGKGTDRNANKSICLFHVKEKEDFNWLEEKILTNGYYEMPGVWSLLISEDKRLMAEITSFFRPVKVLDIGCANGPIMKCLLDLGIASEGIDISRMAKGKAFPEVKDHIHLGDLLSVDFSQTFDVVLGLDVFEHLNPNKLSLYIKKIHTLLGNEGFLYCNIPAFGSDPIFGEIFPVYIQEWEEDIQKNQCFRTIHVDESGYPINGHIIGGDSPWWVQQFEHAGFERELEIERDLHTRYDSTMEKIHVARKAYYVFSKNRSVERIAAIRNKIQTSPRIFH